MKDLRIDQNVIKNNKQELKKLAKKQRSLMSSKQNEIKNINKIYDEKIKLTKNDNLIKLENEKGKLQEEISQAINHKDQKLKEARDHLSQTQQFLSKEENQLKSIHNDKINKIKKDNTLLMQETAQSSQELAGKSQEKLKDTLSDLNMQTKQAIETSRHNSKMMIDKIHHQTNNKVIAATQQKQETLRKLDKNFVMAESKANKLNEDSLTELNEKHQLEEKQRTQIHKDKMALSEKYNKDLTLQERNNFQIRYDKMIKEHTNVMSRLKDTLSKEINNFKLKHAKKLNNQKIKQEDPFYKATVIEPTISEDKDYYFFSVKSPEHEKDQFTISGHKREIKISFARKHFDNASSKEESYSTRRTESLTKTFAVKEIVDARNVKQSYKDGILTFRIDKA